MLTHFIIAFQFGCETVESSTYMVEQEFACFNDFCTDGRFGSYV